MIDPLPQPGALLASSSRFLLDWPSWADAASTISAFAALVLLPATIALLVETCRMRKSSALAAAEARRGRELNERIHAWDVKTHEEAKEPVFIMYLDIDEVENFESIVFENVTDNPAYDVSLCFTPDLELNVYKPGRGENPQLSSVFPRYAVVGPRQRFVRTFSIITDGSGDFAFVGHFENVGVEVTYRTMDGAPRAASFTLDSHHAWKRWFPSKNNLVAVQTQMKASLDELTGAVRQTAGRRRTTTADLRRLKAGARLRRRRRT